MIDFEENKKLVLNLNSGAIHVENKLNIKPRLAWLYMAYKAIATLQLLDKEKVKENIIKFKVDLSELKKVIKYSSTNNEHLKGTLEELVNTKIKWNIFNKDQTRWGIGGLLIFCEIISSKNQAICEYSFAPFIQEKLAYPDMYTKINLLISREFTSKNSFAIYSLALDYLNIKNNYGEKVLTLEEIRNYLGLEEFDYKNSGDLNKWIIKTAEKDINTKSDMNISIEVRKENIYRKNSKIKSFKLKMSIKKEHLEFYKPKNLIGQVIENHQTELFDLETPLLEATNYTNENIIKLKPEKKELIKVENSELKKFYAEHKISITTNTVQEKLREITEMFHDKFENYLIFLMNYAKQELNKKAITNFAGFYIVLLKDDSQLDNYVFYIQKQQENEENKKHKVKALIGNELENRYEKFISTDFEKYLEKDIDKLESKMIKVIESTLKGGDFIYDVVIMKFHSGKIDKTLITDSKTSVKSSVIGYLKSYKNELGYKTISFDEWKKQLTEKYLQELESEIEKSL